jgi:hypothetical protein
MSQSSYTLSHLWEGCARCWVSLQFVSLIIHLTRSETKLDPLTRACLADFLHEPPGFSLREGVSMRQILNRIYLVASLCCLILGAGFARQSQTAGQVPQYPYERDEDDYIILPGGVRTIPENTILRIEMITELNSKYARVGDRILASVVDPVKNAFGQTLIPIGSVVTGVITDVRPAKWPRKAGFVSIRFRRMRMPYGRLYYIEGTLANVKDGKKIRVQDEVGIKPESAVRRDVIIIGGATTTGAIVGSITGSALAGAGIGAVAGITTVLLLPGKNVRLERGDRVGLQLQKRLYVGPYGGPYPCASCYPTTGPVYGPRTDGPVYGPRTDGPVYGPRTDGPVYGPPPVVRGPVDDGGRYPIQEPPLSSPLLGSGLIDLNDVRVERSSDGAVYILLTAETPSTGWQVSTKHHISGESVEVSLYGVPPSNVTVRQTSHPTPSPIVIPDNKGSIRRVIVQAKNGPRTVTVPSSSLLPAPPSPTTPDSPRPKLRPPTPRVQSPGPVDSPRPEPSTPGRGIVNQLERIRYDFGSSVGVWMNQDGSYDVSRSRPLSDDERLLLDRTGSLLKSVRDYENQSNGSSRKDLVERIREDTQSIQQGWARVKMSDDLNQQFRRLFNDLRMLGGSVASPVSRQDLVNPQASMLVPVNPQASRPLTKARSSARASEILNQVQLVQYDFATSIGAWLKQDGSYDSVGTRRITANERQVLDGLRALNTSVRAFDPASERGGNADRVQEDLRRVTQAWQRVRVSQELNKQFIRMSEAIQPLLVGG